MLRIPLLCNVRSGQRLATDVSHPRAPIQLCRAGESTGCILRGPRGPNGLRRGDLPVREQQ